MATRFGCSGCFEFEKTLFDPCKLCSLSGPHESPQKCQLAPVSGNTAILGQLSIARVAAWTDVPVLLSALTGRSPRLCFPRTLSTLAGSL